MRIMTVVTMGVVVTMVTMGIMTVTIAWFMMITRLVMVCIMMIMTKYWRVLVSNRMLEVRVWVRFTVVSYCRDVSRFPIDIVFYFLHSTISHQNFVRSFGVVAFSGLLLTEVNFFIFIFNFVFIRKVRTPVVMVTIVMVSIVMVRYRAVRCRVNHSHACQQREGDLSRSSHTGGGCFV